MMSLNELQFELLYAIFQLSHKENQISSRRCSNTGTGCLCGIYHCRGTKYPGLSRSLDNITSGAPFQATMFCVSMTYKNNWQKILSLKCSRLLFRKDQTRPHNLNVYFLCIESISRPYIKKSQRRSGSGGLLFSTNFLLSFSVYTIIWSGTGKTTKKTPKSHY